MKNNHNRIGPRWKWLLFCGVIAGPLFIITLLIEGATRADYDPIRHPGSSLALGDFGWIQVVNFIVTGLLIVLFAIGLWRALRNYQRSTWGPLLLGWLGIGLIGAGLFLTDPVSGYPSGTPNLIAQPTPHGQMHDLFSLGVFVGLPLACFVFTRVFIKRRERSWAIYSLCSGLGMIITFVFANIAFVQTPGFVEFGGLFQRICLTIGLGWLAVLALKFFKLSSENN